MSALISTAILMFQFGSNKYKQPVYSDEDDNIVYLKEGESYCVQWANELFA